MLNIFSYGYLPLYILFSKMSLHTLFAHFLPSKYKLGPTLLSLWDQAYSGWYGHRPFDHFLKRFFSLMLNFKSFLYIPAYYWFMFLNPFCQSLLDYLYCNYSYVYHFNIYFLLVSSLVNLTSCGLLEHVLDSILIYL